MFHFCKIFLLRGAIAFIYVKAFLPGAGRGYLYVKPLLPAGGSIKHTVITFLQLGRTS